MSSFKSTWAA